MKFIIKHIFFNILIMWRRLKVHTEDLAPARFSCAKSCIFPFNKIKQFLFNSTASIFLYTYYLFLAFKKYFQQKYKNYKKNNRVNM